MTDTAPYEPIPSTGRNLRAFLASLSPEERTALGALLAEIDAAGPGVLPTGVSENAPLPPARPEELPAQVSSLPNLPSPPQEAGTLPLPAASNAPVLNVPKVPGYEILEEIGRGAMGVVYKARQVRLNRLVALKMILSGTAASAQELARFKGEAEAIARLQHPQIVQIFEVGECTLETGATCPFMALELCAGGSLAARLDGRPRPAEEAAPLIAVLARAMHACHSVGIIHRDLKPANVLLACGTHPPPPGTHQPGGEQRTLAAFTPKITDFGLAKKLDEAGQTQSGAILGTPSYMAPEQAAGKPKTVGPRADVYALGAILYELLSGRPPFLAETPLDTMLQVLEHDPVAVRALNPAAPRDLETICLKCLRKEPGQRYANAAELADDLARFLAGEPIRARPPSAVEKLNRWVSRHPVLLTAYLLSGVALFLLLHLQGLLALMVFGTKGVSSDGLHYAAMPIAGLVLIGVLRTNARLFSVAAVLLGGAWATWYGRSGLKLTDAAEPLPLRLLAAAGLAAILVGLLARGRRGLLLALLPALGVGTLVGWSIDKGLAPLLTGVMHGLLVGWLARVVAWGLRRSQAVCALGAVLGAYGGLYFAYWNITSYLTYLRETTGSIWSTSEASLYLELCLAFAGAVVAGLIGSFSFEPRSAKAA
jgi:serine/threonine protein kinase